MNDWDVNLEGLSDETGEARKEEQKKQKRDSENSSRVPPPHFEQNKGSNRIKNRAGTARLGGPVLSETEQYLEFISLYTEYDEQGKYITDSLSWKDDTFCVCWMDTESRLPLKGLGTCFLKWNEIEEYGNRYAGLATLHITINDTDTQGRRTEHIKAARTICLDLDRVIEGGERDAIIQHYSPGLVVETSPGKYHFYWRCSRELKLSEWQTVQRGIAYQFDGDLTLDTVSHIIRVPGFARATKEGETYTPSIVYRGDSRRWDWNSLVETFPDLLENSEKCKHERTVRNKKLHKAVKNILNSLNGSSKKLHSLKAISTGTRNSALYMLVRQYVASHGELLSEQDTQDIACKLNESLPEPLGVEEVTKIARQGWIYGSEQWEARKEEIREAQAVLDVATGKLESMSDKEEGWDVDLENVQPTPVRKKEAVRKAPAKSELPVIHERPDFNYNYKNDVFLGLNRFTDLAVQARVMQRYGHRLIKVDGKLYAFNERECLWRPQDASAHSEINEWVKQCCIDVVKDEMFMEELCLTADRQFSHEKQQKAIARFMSNNLVGNTSRQLLQDNSVRRAGSEVFDAQAYYFYALNGVVDLLTGSIRRAAASDYLRVQGKVEWLPSARCDEFIKELHEIFAENDEPEEMVRFLQEVFGYSLTGDIGEQKIFCHFGGGSNGKSVVLEALKMILGDYGSTIAPGDMTTGKNMAIKSFERFAASIENKRVGIIDDLDVGSVWNESFVKNTTGEVLRVRNLYNESREMKNKCKLHCGLNEAPKPQAENYGILRRLCIIPYLREFEQSNEQWKRLMDLVKREGAGILQWAREGLLRIKKQGGIRYPGEVLGALEVYRQENFQSEDIILAMFEASDDGSYLTFEEIYEDIKANPALLVTGSELSKTKVGTILGKLCKSKLYKIRKVLKRIYYIKRVKNDAQNMIISSEYELDELGKL